MGLVKFLHVFYSSTILLYICIQYFQTIVALDVSKAGLPQSCQSTSSSFLNFTSQNHVIPWSAKKEIGKPLKILLWNKFNESNSKVDIFLKEIMNGECPNDLNGNNCIFTKSMSEIDTSDAILFHISMSLEASIRKNGLPSLSSSKRMGNQLWIAMVYEPPSILKSFGMLRNISRLNGIFNRTMSYRSDADITVRYGSFLKLNSSQLNPKHTTEKNEFSSIGNLPTWIDSHEDSKTQRNYADGKSHLVAWFASARGCTSGSKREVYVSQLQKYIKVDIYGKCGPLKCGSSRYVTTLYRIETDECYQMLSRSYKFVLAFENSICSDYITEKLYNHLRLNVVPIVFGGGDYEVHAPPHSVIDASKFSPKELAAYLLLLDNNDTLYNEYFEWKKDYNVISNDGVPLACDLCIKLNNATWRNEAKVYEGFDRWIIGNCSKGYGK